MPVKMMFARGDGFGRTGIVFRHYPETAARNEFDHHEVLTIARDAEIIIAIRWIAGYGVRLGWRVRNLPDFILTVFRRGRDETTAVREPCPGSTHRRAGPSPRLAVS